jgi:hypothetical protein
MMEIKRNSETDEELLNYDIELRERFHLLSREVVCSRLREYKKSPFRN